MGEIISRVAQLQAHVIPFSENMSLIYGERYMFDWRKKDRDELGAQDTTGESRVRRKSRTPRHQGKNARKGG